jgi:hypothetical protein
MKIFKILALITGCIVLIDVIFDVFDPGYKRVFSRILNIFFLLMMVTLNKKVAF